MRIQVLDMCFRGKARHFLLRLKSLAIKFSRQRVFSPIEQMLVTDWQSACVTMQTARMSSC